ncbi:LysR family transcriptional regulator [Chelatococcus reniformis]|uniref:HTH lysR-type domain-containing protein n=1 Tax=Chelatococcus reniformis TaxID=1494448 RepID=A0A916UQ22_9HYPH|nr:LysR family transcriptional regulator [Chelatococcus reniformis]GGC82263.1 hypothetical protein GCM10010994_45230 [Chelatococcus reniformis]
MEGPVNLRSWRHFLLIAEAGSFTRAALQLRVAQPVLSREMAELERQLGARLFHRHARGVRLSAAGDRFRLRAQDILKSIDEVPHELADARSEPVGTLAVGMPPSMGGYITSEAIKVYRARYPAVRLNVSILPGEECYERLVERYLDIGVIASRRGQRGLDTTPLLADDVGLFGAHQLLEGVPDSVSIKELAELPLMLAPAPTFVHDLLSAEFMREGMRLKTAVEANLWAVTELVRGGVGLSIFSECAKGTFDPGSVRFIRVLGPAILWSIATLSYRPVTPAATAFAGVLRAIVDQKSPQATWAPARDAQS